MNVRYLGHSSFLINSSKGSSIITDPFGSTIPYDFPDISSDIVLISHEHHDHNADWRVKNSPVVVKRTTNFQVEHEVVVQKTKEKFNFCGIPTYHDKHLGRKKGPNTIWVWHIEGVRFCFLGDIGHILSEVQVKSIGGDCDVLFLPVGGLSTVDPTDAVLIINQLFPKIVFPMHFHTSKLEFSGLADSSLESFLNKVSNVENAYAMSTDIELSTLPRKTKTIVLKYE